MKNRIEYNGFEIQSTSRLKDEPSAWTVEVHITPLDRSAPVRRCRGPYTYATQQEAVKRSLKFGRLIVDGKLKPTKKSAN